MPGLGYVGSRLASSNVTLNALYNGNSDGGTVYSIGAATRSSGVWSKFSGNPVLTAASGWESLGVKDPRLVWDGTQYVMFYSGYDGGLNFQIGRATSSLHTGPWARYGGNPVIAHGTGSDPDVNGASAPTVVYNATAPSGHKWWMWYYGKGASVTSICVAHSDDGITWTKDGAVLTGSGSGWESTSAGAGAVYFDGTTWSLFYNSNFRVGLATATSPTGTYTKSGSNPLILPRSTTAHTAANPSDSSVGATVLTVPSGTAAGLQVGEPVLIVDSANGPEQNLVASSASTTVTLSRVLQNAYTAANGSTLRSFMYTAISNTDIQPTDTGYELFGTGYRGLDGLTFAGNALWEGSIRWTATSLSGPWSYDYTTGLFFQLYPSTTGWDKYSAENPTVVVAP